MLWELFSTFVLIGFFSFGGGLGMLPLIQDAVVYNHAWLSVEDFTNIVALSEMTPGPLAVNSATYIGYNIAGIPGSIFAMLGLTIPPLIIIITLSNILIKNKESYIIKGVLSGLRPVMLGLIAYAGAILAWEGVSNTIEIIFCAAAVCLILFTKIHPALVIIIFGILGVLVL
ncbi:MAG: chromate transporter [Bacillota bacterium]|jgi:chromate transporter